MREDCSQSNWSIDLPGKGVLLALGETSTSSSFFFPREGNSV